MNREIEGKKYSFRMTRAGIRAAERAGMNMSEIGDKPMEALYYLWFAALYAEHPMQIKQTDKLLDAYLDDPSCPEAYEDLIKDLSDQYAAVFGVATA